MTDSLSSQTSRVCCEVYRNGHLPCCDCPMYDDEVPGGTLPEKREEPPEWGHGPASLGPVAP